MPDLTPQEKRDLNVKLASIITTLADFPTGCPESTVYLALWANLSEWSLLKVVLTSSGYLTEKGNWLKITPKGNQLAAQIMAHAQKGA